MFPCRLMIGPPAEGAWNMAVDGALLNLAADEGLATLRFYQWNAPTLSLGYFQSYAERDGHAPSRGAAAVRRATGGGALVHDRELTYSLCLPAAHPLARQSTSLYGLVHRSLIDVLAAYGVKAALHRELAPIPHTPSAALDHFLCFERRTGDDIVAPATSPHGAAPRFVKVAGSAQHRRRGAVLQHGGVLLDASPCAPELPGIQQLCGVSLAAVQFAQKCSAQIGETLQLALTAVDSGHEAALPGVAALLQKFESSSWTRRR